MIVAAPVKLSDIIFMSLFIIGLYTAINFLEKKFPNVKVILSEKNLGNGGGINLGLSQVKTKYAFYIDIDTEIKKDTIKNDKIESRNNSNYSLQQLPNKCIYRGR